MLIQSANELSPKTGPEKTYSYHLSFFIKFLTVLFVSDHRSDDLALSSAISMFSIIAGYLYVVKILLPDFMRNRKPFKIRKILIVYNIFQITSNAYIAYEVVSELSQI